MLLLLALLAGPGGQVEQTRLHARLAGANASIQVDVRAGVDRSVEKLSFSLLEIGGANVGGLEASVGTTPLDVTIDRSSPTMVRGSLTLPSTREADLEIAFRYTVTGPRPILPVARLDLPPARSHPEAFVADVEIPNDLDYDPDFPSHVERRSDGTYHWELPAAPSFLSFAGPGPSHSHLSTLFEAGFSFWGLFAAFGAVLALYVLWMVWVEA